MLDLLNFAFSSFWKFIGCAILLSIVCRPFHVFFEVLAARIGKSCG